MNKREEERKIIREVIDYAYDENIEHNADYEEIEKIREWITRIVELEAQEMGYRTRVIIGDNNLNELARSEDNGELVLCFLRNNVENSSFGIFYVDISKDFSPPRIPIIAINEYYHEYALENEKEKPIDPFIGMIDNAFHELSHMRRHLMGRTGVSSYIALINAKESFIQEKYYKFYSKNHDSMRNEEDANLEAVKNWMEVYDGERRRLKRFASFHKIGIMKIQRDDFTFNMFDILMKKKSNRYILKVYPALQKEYNEDGTKKSSKELLENMKSEIEEYLNTDGLSNSEKDILIKDCKGMYFEILYREMKKNATLQDLNCLAEAYDKENKATLFLEMKSYFEEAYKREKKDIEETGFFTSTKEQEQEIKLRENYYQDKIDFLNLIVEQQQNENLLNGIINKGKKFIRMR